MAFPYLLLPTLKKYWLASFLLSSLFPFLLPFFSFLHPNIIRQAQMRQKSWGRQAQGVVGVHMEVGRRQGPEIDRLHRRQVSGARLPAITQRCKCGKGENWNVHRYADLELEALIWAHGFRWVQMWICVYYKMCVFLAPSIDRAWEQGRPTSNKHTYNPNLGFEILFSTERNQSSWSNGWFQG